MATRFDKLHEAFRELGGTGTVFVPEDVESMYEMLGQDEDWPEFDEVREELLQTRDWRKGIAEALAQEGNELIIGMVLDFMRERA